MLQKRTCSQHRIIQIPCSNSVFYVKLIKNLRLTSIVESSFVMSKTVHIGFCDLTSGTPCIAYKSQIKRALVVSHFDIVISILFKYSLKNSFTVYIVFFKSFVPFVLLGNGDGTFGEAMNIPIGSFGSGTSTSIGDFNKDRLPDIALADSSSNSIVIAIGNEDGTFSNKTVLFTDVCVSPTGISLADLNGDNYLDIVVACIANTLMIVYFGNVDMSFQEKLILATGYHTFPDGIALSDFNGDSYLDIVVVNSDDRTLTTFIAQGNGSFDMPKTSFTGGGDNPSFIAVGDFNEDTIQDIALAYAFVPVNGILFGYGNGTFSDKKRLVVGYGYTYSPIAVSDFNKDGHLDVAIVSYIPYTINVFYGDGHGNFQMHTILFTQLSGGTLNIIAADFNDDGYPDIVSTFTIPAGMIILLNTGLCNTSHVFETSTFI